MCVRVTGQNPTAKHGKATTHSYTHVPPLKQQHRGSASCLRFLEVLRNCNGDFEKTALGGHFAGIDGPQSLQCDNFIVDGVTGGIFYDVELQGKAQVGTGTRSRAIDEGRRRQLTGQNYSASDGPNSGHHTTSLGLMLLLCDPE